jgi:hypothetical protein
MRILYLTYFLFLGACAPTNYVYVKKFGDKIPTIENVIIVVEYLDIKQGFGQYWKFDEAANLIQQNYLFETSAKMLEGKGYHVSPSFLKTSGLILDRNFRVKHYLGKQVMPELITPPYIIRSFNINDDNIHALEYLLAGLNRPMSAVMSDLRGYVVNNYIQEIQGIDLPENTGIFIIQSYKPKSYPFGEFNVGIGGSSFDTSVGIRSDALPATTHAYFLHKGTGDLLWSNKISLINNKNQEKFFMDLPKNHSDYPSE